MNNPRVFADFHNADEYGRLRLNCAGTQEDLSRQHIQLQENTQLTLYSEDLEVDAIVQYSEQEYLWVAKIDWEQIREIEEEDQTSILEKPDNNPINSGIIQNPIYNK